MTVFIIYLLVASVTPLFLWAENRRLAVWQLPFILAMWIGFVLYLTVELSMFSLLLFGVLFIGNVIFAHVAAFLIYIAPSLAKRHTKEHFTA